MDPDIKVEIIFSLDGGMWSLTSLVLKVLVFNPSATTMKNRTEGPESKVFRLLKRSAASPSRTSSTSMLLKI